MPDELSSAVEALEAALARAGELAEPEDLQPVRNLISQIRARRGFFGRTLVVAIAGGTGSGKSSLLNALAGEEISPTGPVRPTTDLPIAWIPARPNPELIALLDDLGVDDRVGHGEYPHLAVIDLPDFDSFVTDHRAAVEALVPRVDAVIWVAEPEKYNDRVLHQDFIVVFRRYEDQFAFVLNQIDLVSEDEASRIARDWERILRQDGVETSQILCAAAAPGKGPVRGITELVSHLEARLDAKRAVRAKMATDLLQAADRLAEATGVGKGGGVGFDGRWARSRRTASEELVGNSMASPEGGERAAVETARRPVPVRRRSPGNSLDDEGRLAKAVTTLSAFVADLSIAAGGGFGARLRDTFPRARLKAACTAARAEAGGGAVEVSPRPAWKVIGLVEAVVALVAVGVLVLAVWAGERTTAIASGLVSLLILIVAEAWLRLSGRSTGREAARKVTAARDAVMAHLDRELGIPLRTMVRERAELGALLAELGVVAARARPD